MVPLIKGGAGKAACLIEQVGCSGDTAERFFDAFERADRDIELLCARARKLRSCARPRLRPRQTMPGAYFATSGKGAHQHLPTLPKPLGPANDGVERNKDVTAPGRTILKDLIGRQMPTANLHAGCIGCYQGDGDAESFLVANEVIGVIGLECQTEHGGNWGERYIALVPTDP